MRITLPLPSRNRPAGLLSVLTAMDALATGKNEIVYAVIVDDDDYVTLEQLTHWEKSGMLPAGVKVLAGPRDKTINARVNEAIAKYPAEIYSQIVDDGFPLTQHWDTLLAGAKDLPAFAWQEANDPANATFLVISERWRAATGRFYPEHFPFWFADTWIAEVYNLAFAKPIGVVNQLRMGGKRGTTQGMRDLRFWFDFFAATRIERIAEAEAIARAYGFTLNAKRERAEAIQRMEQADDYQRMRVPVYEETFKSNLGEPSNVYKAARYKAEVWMAEHEKVAA